MAATTTAGHRRCHHQRSPSSPLDAAEHRPTMLLRPPPTATVPIAVNEEEDDAVVVLIYTHHWRASLRTIRIIHHDEDDAHIPDLLRPQADVDHRGHTRRVFLARPISPFIFPNPSVVIFVTSKCLTSRSMPSIMSTRSSRSRNCWECTQRTAKIVCPCCPTTLAASSHLVRMLLARTRHRPAEGDHRQMIPAVDHGPLQTLPSHERLPRPSRCPSPLPPFKITSVVQARYRSPKLAAHMHAPSELPSPARRQRWQRRRRPLFCLKAAAKATVPSATVLHPIFYK
ncbi:hypothetical protein ACLOJK_028854 [Asimina triloba]